MRCRHAFGLIVFSLGIIWVAIVFNSRMSVIEKASPLNLMGKGTYYSLQSAVA
jgi:hypothetical protein